NARVPNAGVLIGAHAIRVTMAEAVERADSQNPTVRAAIAAVLGADGNVALARSAYFPVIRYQNDGTIRYSNAPNFVSGAPRLYSATAAADAQLNATMTL